MLGDDRPFSKPPFHEMTSFYFPSVQRKTSGPSLVVQLELVIIEAIEQGTLRIGTTLPSIRKMAELHNISTFTVVNAYQRLVAAGWLEARHGSGHKVASPSKINTPKSVLPWKPPRFGPGWLLADIMADHSVPVKAGGGWLPPEWLDDTNIGAVLRDLSRVPVTQLTNYGHPHGYPPLREVIAEDMSRHGLVLSPRQVMTTNGASQALDLIIRSLLQPGELVVVESPAYANLLQMLRLAGLRTVSIKRKHDGLDLVKLEEIIRTSRPRALFVNTVLHNPTGTSLSINNAYRILQLTERSRMWIIEDDIARELVRSTAPMLAAMEGLERVIYVAGYSKTLNPAMRVGFLAAHIDVMDVLVRTKMASGLTSSEIMERMAYQLISDSEYATHLRKIRNKLAGSHDRVIALMEKRKFEIFAKPGSGLFLWARPPVLSEEVTLKSQTGANKFAEMALQHGVWLAPGSHFDPQERDVSWMRFNVGYSDNPQLWEFVDNFIIGASNTH